MAPLSKVRTTNYASLKEAKDNQELAPDLTFSWALRAYLAEPNKKHKKEIKKAALILYETAHIIAKEKHPNKYIGSDEWMAAMDDELLNPVKSLYLSKEKYQLLDDLVEELRVVEKSDLSMVLYLALLPFEKNIQLNNYEDKIYSDIYHLKMQAQALIKRGHPKAAKEVMDLFDKMDKRTGEYLAEPSKERQKNYVVYKQDMQAFAQEGIDSKLLKEHRGLEKTVKNIMISLSILGLIYLAATAKSRGSFWLQPDTVSIKKLKLIKEDLTKPFEENHNNSKTRLKK